MAEIPEQVGPYRIVSEVGRGGMAVVYLARQPALARDVAVKELAPGGTTDPALARRFLLEARVSGSLNHPNVVTVYDFLEHDGVPYIAMEYVERGSLRPVIGKRSLAQAAGVLEGLLAALSHAESMRIVHRDVKPENLLVTAEGGIKIADFGIAKALQQVATEEMLTPAGATAREPAVLLPPTGGGAGGRDGREAGVHGARAGDGLRGRPVDRPLSVRRRRVRAALGRGPVPRRRVAGGGDDAAHQRSAPAAAGRHGPGAGGVGAPDGRQGPGGEVPQRRRCVGGVRGDRDPALRPALASRSPPRRSRTHARAVAAVVAGTVHLARADAPPGRACGRRRGSGAGIPDLSSGATGVPAGAGGC